MKIFISGASGFIGRHVSFGLADRGHEVVGLVKDRKDGRVLENAGAKFVIGDLLEGGLWCDEVRTADKVISLSKPYTDDEIITKDRVSRLSALHTEMVTNLIKAAADGRARQVIVTNHTLCLGNSGGSWISNADFLDPIGYCRPIADTFDAVDKTAEDAGIGLVMTYPSMVYGNGGWFARLIERFRNGAAKVVSPGDNYLNLIHVDDLAGLYSAIVEKVETGDVFILTDGTPVTQNDLMSLIANSLGVPGAGMVDFDEYSRMFGWLEAESMASNAKISGIRAIDVLEYSMKKRSYEKGVSETIREMSLGMKKAA